MILLHVRIEENLFYFTDYNLNYSTLVILVVGSETLKTILSYWIIIFNKEKEKERGRERKKKRKKSSLSPRDTRSHLSSWMCEAFLVKLQSFSFCSPTPPRMASSPTIRDKRTSTGKTVTCVRWVSTSLENDSYMMSQIPQKQVQELFQQWL